MDVGEAELWGFDSQKNLLYHFSMALHTTLPLDDDVAAAIDEAMHRRGQTFEETVNESLRAGLRLLQDSPRPFKVQARALEARPGLRFDKISELLDELEGPDHR
jgi:hypothetical protein